MQVLQERVAASRRRGSVLVYALATVLLIGGLSASFLQISTGASRRQAEGLEKKQAFYLAEAGLTEALVGLAQGRTGNVGTPEQPAAFGDGLFWVEARELGAGLSELECRARSGGASALLSIVVEEGQPGVAALGLFGVEALHILPGSMIDSFDSSAGAYVPQRELPLDPPSSMVSAIIGSGGGVTIAGTTALPTQVRGDVFAGPGSEVVVSGRVRLTGETGTLLEQAALPAIQVPELPAEAGLEHDGPYPLVVPAGASGFEFLRVQAESEVIVQGPATLVLGALEVQPGGSLTLDASGGPIRLFVDGPLALAPESNLVVMPQDPTLVSIQVAGEPEAPLELYGEASFFGLFYAPQANVAVASSFEIFGSIVAEQLGFVGPVRLHFDLTLAEQAIEASRPSLVSWRIVELENQIGATGADPFVLIGIDPSLGLPPALAHADQFVEIRYYDASHTLQTYAGPESGFDWSDAAVVATLVRDGKQVKVVSGVVDGLRGLLGGLLPVGP